MAKNYDNSAKEIKMLFDEAVIADKVEFINWFLDNFDKWVQRDIKLVDHPIEEISEATGISKEYIMCFIDNDLRANDSLTNRLIFQFARDLPVLELSKIASIDRRKIEKIKDLRIKHPHCLDELLTLYFEIQYIIKSEALEEFIRKKPGRKRQIENLGTNEIKRIEDRRMIEEKLALFLKKKKTKALSEMGYILEIRQQTLKNIVSANFTKKCMSNPSCPYQKYLKI